MDFGTNPTSSNPPQLSDEQLENLRKSLLQQVQQDFRGEFQQLATQLQQAVQQQLSAAVVSPVAPVVAGVATPHAAQQTTASSAAPRAKMNCPENFTGAVKQNIEDFCFSVKRYVAYCGLSLDNPKAVEVASSYLHGRPAQWWRVHCQRYGPPVSVDDFCELLRKQFRAPNFEVHARDQLTKLSQRDNRDGLRSYTYTFLSLVTQLPQMTEQEEVYNFIKGLLPKLRAELRARNPATLEDAMSVADTLDHAWREAYQPSGRRSTWQPPPPNPNGPSPMQLDSLQLRNSNGQRGQQQQQQQGQRQTQTQSSMGGFNGQRNNFTPKCQLCRKRGHTADKCPLLSHGTSLPGQQRSQHA